MSETERSLLIITRSEDTKVEGYLYLALTDTVFRIRPSQQANWSSPSTHGGEDMGIVISAVLRGFVVDNHLTSHRLQLTPIDSKLHNSTIPRYLIVIRYVLEIASDVI